MSIEDDYEAIKIITNILQKALLAGIDQVGDQHAHRSIGVLMYLAAAGLAAYADTSTEVPAETEFYFEAGSVKVSMQFTKREDRGALH